MAGTIRDLGKFQWGIDATPGTLVAATSIVAVEDIAFTPEDTVEAPRIAQGLAIATPGQEYIPMRGRGLASPTTRSSLSSCMTGSTWRSVSTPRPRVLVPTSGLTFATSPPPTHRRRGRLNGARPTVQAPSITNGAMLSWSLCGSARPLITRCRCRLRALPGAFRPRPSRRLSRSPRVCKPFWANSRRSTSTTAGPG